jgi:hypothetical protein
MTSKNFRFHEFFTIYILEMTTQRFPSVRTYEIKNIIKKWLHYAKNRVRKANKSIFNNK